MINPLAHASSPGLLTPLPDFFAAQSLSRMDAFSAWGMMARFPRVSNNGGPFCLIFADGISAEEIVFKQLRGCQIDTEKRRVPPFAGNSGERIRKAALENTIRKVQWYEVK